MRIVAIDVGGTAGVALRLGTYIATMSMTNPEDVWQFIATNEWDVVIYENFATSSFISKYGLYTVRLIGGIQAICMLKSTKCIGQQPQYRKAFIANADVLLKSLRVTNQDYTVHEKDALAHLLAFEHYRDLQKSKEST